MSVIVSKPTYCVGDLDLVTGSAFDVSNTTRRHAATQPWILVNALMGQNLAWTTTGPTGAPPASSRWQWVTGSNGSSVSSTYNWGNSPSDTAAVVVANNGTAHSWCVLQSPPTFPGGPVQILISSSVIATVAFSLYWSVAGFTGGTVASNPTATDQRQNGASDSYANILNNVTTNQRINLMIDADGCWALFVGTEGSGFASGWLSCWEVVPFSAADTNRFFTQNVLPVSLWNGGTSVFGWSLWSSTWHQTVLEFSARYSITDPFVAAGTGQDPDGYVQIENQRVALVDNAVRGPKGYARDWFHGFSAGPNYGAPSAGDQELLCLAVSAGGFPPTWVPFNFIPLF